MDSFFIISRKQIYKLLFLIFTILLLKYKTVYGYGYAWDKDPYTINVGDYITWHWETPQYVSDIGYGVHQTETSSDLSNKPGGFSSGEKSRIGRIKFSSIF